MKKDINEKIVNITFVLMAFIAIISGAWGSKVATWVQIAAFIGSVVWMGIVVYLREREEKNRGSFDTEDFFGAAVERSYREGCSNGKVRR